MSRWIGFSHASARPFHHINRFQLSSQSSFATTQVLAPYIVVVSGLWNEIEARTAAFLAALLGREAKTGISVLFAITNDGAKRAAIDAICGLKLSTEDQTRFRAILQRIGERYTDRNRAVHGVWGISRKYPESLLWADTRASVLHQVEVMAAKDQTQRNSLHLKFQRDIQVWNQRDLEAVIQRLDIVWGELQDFTGPMIDRAIGRAGGRSVRQGPSLPQK